MAATVVFTITLLSLAVALLVCNVMAQPRPQVVIYGGRGGDGGAAMGEGSRGGQGGAGSSIIFAGDPSEQWDVVMMMPGRDGQPGTSANGGQGGQGGQGGSVHIQQKGNDDEKK